MGGLVYLVGARSAGACWYFQNEEDYLRRMVGQLNPEVLKSSLILRRSSSAIGTPERWLPVSVIATQGSPMAVQMDRGPEKLLLLAPKTEY
jgi:hypothetical protein